MLLRSTREIINGTLTDKIIQFKREERCFIVEIYIYIKISGDGPVSSADSFYFYYASNEKQKI